MRNLTLAIPEDVLRKARIRAVKDGTSVNEVVRRHLEEYGSQEERIREAVARILEASAKYHGRAVRGPGGRRWTREELYDRKGPGEP